MTLGSDAAIVCLLGEVFVEPGLVTTQGSPLGTTLSEPPILVESGSFCRLLPGSGLRHRLRSARCG